jgi:unsaturated chondroitin disaccharide hydrolase
MQMKPEPAATRPRSGTDCAVHADFARAFQLGAEKTRRNIRKLADDPRACAWAADGDYFQHPGEFLEIGNWTTSFFTGMALLAWGQTEEKFFLDQVERLASHYRSKVFEHRRDTMHDLGFLYSLYSVALHQLTANPDHREVGLQAAALLADRFEAKGGYLRAWGRMEELDTHYAGLAIVDSMMNLPLLYWASAQTRDDRFRSIATRHASATLRHFIRADGSVCHAYRFDPETGIPRGADNYCGYGMDSHWARSTAWAIYGFALGYAHTRDSRHLQASLRLAQQFLKETSDEPVPVWDFASPPSSKALRDSSAAAIAACGFQELSRLAGRDSTLAAAARRVLTRLCEAAYLDADPKCPGLLKHAQVGNGTIGQALAVYASWGDYFFMEALSRELGGKVNFWRDAAVSPELTV